jgi:hypothetical protein
MSLEEMTEDQRNSLALKKLFNHPEVGSQAKRLWKKITPDAKFADIDLEDKLADREKKLQERMDKMEEDELNRRVEAKRKENHQMVRDAGLDPALVEKVMTDEKILNYDTAVKYIKGQNANSAPTPSLMTPITMPDNAKEIAKNPSAWARDEAFKAINELKTKRGF